MKNADIFKLVFGYDAPSYCHVAAFADDFGHVEVILYCCGRRVEWASLNA